MNIFAKNLKDMDKQSVKDNILKARKDLHLTQEEMARKLGLSRTAYRNFEKGETEVFCKHISKIAELSGKSEEELVLGYTPGKNNRYFLREVADCRESMQQLRKEYEKRLEEKDQIIQALKSNVQALESVIKMYEGPRISP